MTDEAPAQNPAQPANTVRKAACSQCGGPRNCEIRGCYAQECGDRSGNWTRTAWYILECRGCEHVFVQMAGEISGDVDESIEPDGHTTIYQNEILTYWPALSKRRRPEWLHEYWIDIDDCDRLKNALHELYGALDNDLNMLAAIGIRTCVDIAIELLGFDNNSTFDTKLDALVEAEAITKRDLPRLKTAITQQSVSKSTLARKIHVVI